MDYSNVLGHLQFFTGLLLLVAALLLFVGVFSVHPDKRNTETSPLAYISSFVEAVVGFCVLKYYQPVHDNMEALGVLILLFMAVFCQCVVRLYYLDLLRRMFTKAGRDEPRDRP